MGRFLAACLALVLLVVPATTQENPSKPSFSEAASSITRQLQAAMANLDNLYQTIAAEKIPFNAQLNELQKQLIEGREEYQSTTRLLDRRTLDLTNLQGQIKSRNEELAYVQNLLTEYMRNFESRLHVAEKQHLGGALDQAGMATSNTNLTALEVMDAQLGLVEISIDRIESAFGGHRFEGRALDQAGVVSHGDFLVFGPVAFFGAADGQVVGLAKQRLNSSEPAVMELGNPLDRNAVASVFSKGRGSLPFDATLGNALKMEATQESLLEHIKKGGAVMWPILGMAGFALLVALTKWISILIQPVPSQKQIDGVREAVGRMDGEAAEKRAAHLRGPLGRMLEVGVKHMREPRELVEEVMYEAVLTTRLRLNSSLPFISICAASAPLLGLLGTVTGIINTFKMITVFGSGDVKSLSGGISEALITTKFGLIVAIPSLLLHAFLSRMAKSRIDRMEKAAVSFVNELAKADKGRTDGVDANTKLQPSLTPGNMQANYLPQSQAMQPGIDVIFSRLLEEVDELRQEVRGESSSKQAAER